jgi:hypothetical protein
MELVCIGCLSPVDGDAGEATTDGGTVCPQCGPREDHQLVRRPVAGGESA